VKPTAICYAGRGAAGETERSREKSTRLLLQPRHVGADAAGIDPEVAASLTALRAHVDAASDRLGCHADHGLALLIVPALVGQLLLGEELTGVAILVARVAGIALIALGIACWPGPPLVGILTYSAVVTLYLAYLGLVTGLTSLLLWPAVIFHIVLSILLGRAWLATEAT
jgi:hypothetical protein